MATNKSEHLQLNLWEPEDSVLREEFNENWEKLDDAAERLESELAAGLEEVKASQPVQHLATGSYKGNGGTQTVSLGFKPAVVLVFNQRIDVSAAYLGGAALSGAPASEQYNSTKLLIITDSGFKAVNGSNASLNSSGYTYNYLAIG